MIMTLLLAFLSPVPAGTGSLETALGCAVPHEKSGQLMFRETVRLKLGWALVLGLLLLASAEFLVRGPIRFARASNFNDFISPYIQTRAWMEGVDPYSPANLVALWAEGRRAVFVSEEGSG